MHVLATPLITKADGTKYGKTEGGSVWLDAEMTSPYAFFQFWLNAEDAIVGTLLRVFTFRSREEIEALEESARERPHLREAQRALAQEVTTLVHGAAARSAGGGGRPGAVRPGRGGELAGLDAATLRDATAELPQAAGQVGDRFVDLMAATGLVAGRNAARRAVAEGGAYLNNAKVTDPERALLGRGSAARWGGPDPSRPALPRGGHRGGLLSTDRAGRGLAGGGSNHPRRGATVGPRTPQ